MKKQYGFTLIELMIVVAIIGIISAIAYPSYQKFMLKSSRSDAYVALMRMADAQERYYLQNNSYSANVADVGGAASTEGLYTLAVAAADASSYTLTADGIGSAQANDTGCVVLTLTSAGQKTPADCWN